MEKDIKKSALLSGLVLGLVLCVLSVVVFYIIIASTSIWLTYLVPIIFSVILPIAIAIVMGLDLRKKAGGFWTLKQATTGIFIMFIIAYIVNTIGRDVIFVKLVEPDMVQKTETAVINSTTKMMEKRGASQDEIDSQVEMTRKRFDEEKNVTVGKIITGIGTTIILVFVLALIFAAVLKKERPLFDVADTEDLTV